VTSSSNEVGVFAGGDVNSNYAIISHGKIRIVSAAHFQTILCQHAFEDLLLVITTYILEPLYS